MQQYVIFLNIVDLVKSFSSFQRVFSCRNWRRRRRERASQSLRVWALGYRPVNYPSKHRSQREVPPLAHPPAHFRCTVRFRPEVPPLAHPPAPRGDGRREAAPRSGPICGRGPREGLPRRAARRGRYRQRPGRCRVVRRAYLQKSLPIQPKTSDILPEL